ncbi:hypothetical protein Xmau_04478 [Xenorhabdus mauleonii]|uniref:Uncharacterized protein n=1 Tax=Xenorhabdus mauleonii TaxID=351675 RepID=A0A1I3YD91_9GAMM|nr:hypothetical protein [Xenorhabdus mauleonii]PHM35620.1 hypothetical protein Xmau_04478 [Xenorhabdus mauleonii]SFK29339.1 hypothetical protein SAMN05421680_14911 [Xenorhabdus mauleonii]
MIQSGVLFFMEKIFSAGIFLRENRREKGSVYLYSVAKVLPICRQFSDFVQTQKRKKPPDRWLFLTLTCCITADFYMVPRAGLEPAQPYSRGILNSSLYLYLSYS